MQTRAVLLLAGMIVVPLAGAQVTCDRFKILCQHEGNTLIVSLDTDLPDYTSIMVGVGRDYWEKGNDVRYAADYYSSKETVGEWRKAHRIDIADSKWMEELRKKQAKMAKIGLGFDVAKIGEQVEVSMVVHINQPNQAFGKENENLTGAAVSAKGLRTVGQELKIQKPFGLQASGSSPYENIDPQDLTTGNAYFVSRKTPLMPDHSPSDPMVAMQQMKSIPPGGAFKILARHRKGNTPWYEVVALDTNRKRIGKGWINSTALLGQDIEPYKKTGTSN